MMAGSKNNSTKSNPDSNHPDNNKSSTPRAPKTSGFHNVWSTSAGPNGFVGGLFGGGAVSGHSDAASANFNPSTFKRDPDAKIYNGTCKWYNSQRGFGFIIPDDMALNFGDVFVHHTVILSKGFRSLNAGERLEFTVSGCVRVYATFFSQMMLFVLWYCLYYSICWIYIFGVRIYRSDFKI